MRWRSYILIIISHILICFSLQGFANGTNPTDKSQEDIAVEAINKQIEKNESLKKLGRFDETNYIVDVRGSWWMGDANTVTAENLVAVNSKLQEYNNGEGLGFYVLLSAPYVYRNKFYLYNADNSITYIKDGVVETLPPPNSDEWHTNQEENEAKLAEMYDLKNRYSAEYTKNVAEKSRISDASGKGILLNIEALLPIYVDADNQKFMQYISVVALGKRLSKWAMEQVHAKISRGIDKNRSFAEDFNGTLIHYVDKIGSNAVALNKEQGNSLTADETGVNIEGKVFEYESSDHDLITKLLNYKAPEFPEEQDLGDIKLLDYAGISSLDPSFVSSIKGNVQDHQGELSIGDLVTHKVQLYIITTSDSSLHFEQNAIQLALEKKNGLTGNFIVLGLHFRLDKNSIRNDKVYFDVHASSYFSNQLKRDLIDMRNELGYNVFRNTRTGEVVLIRDFFTGPQLPVHRDDNDYFYSDFEYVANYAYRVPLTTKLIVNDASSSWIVPACLAWTGGQIEDFLRAHEDQAAGWVLDIAFTAATGGIYGVTKTIVQAGVRVTKGAVLDVATQVALIMLLYPEKSFEQALDEISYSNAMYAGVESFIDDWKTTAALACVRELMVGSQKSTKEGNELIKELAINCSQALLMELIFNKATPKIKSLLLKRAQEKFPELIEALVRMKSDLSSQDIIKFLKSIGFLEETALNLYKTKASFLKRVSWINNITLKDRTAKDFWADASADFNHYIEGDIYIKHNSETGEHLVGNTQTGEIIRYESNADLTQSDYPALARRSSRTIAQYKALWNSLTDVPKTFKHTYVLWRRVNINYQPAVTHPKQVTNTVNRYSKGREAIYFGTSRDVTDQEWLAYNPATGLKGDDGSKLYRFEVEEDGLLDLTNLSVLQKLDIDKSLITKVDDKELPQELGDWAFNNGYKGVVFPSARMEGGVNIVIFKYFPGDTPPGILRFELIETIK